MFSHVQFSTRVIFGFAILLSNHVFCQPCRHFRVDKFSMIFFTRTSIFAWVNTTILLLCINRQLKCCNPGRCPSSHFTEDSGVLTSSFGHYSAAQIVTSLHLRLLARSTVAGWPFHHWLFDLMHLRATHCPVRAIVDSLHRHHLHHRPSIILRATHPSEPCLVDRHHRHPARYLRRLFSPDFTERRITKTPSTITASSTSSRRPRVHQAPHHLLLVSALFAASRASSMSCTILHPSR